MRGSALHNLGEQQGRLAGGRHREAPLHGAQLVERNVPAACSRPRARSRERVARAAPRRRSGGGASSASRSRARARRGPIGAALRVCRLGGGACVIHSRSMCMACVWHVYGMCMACVRDPLEEHALRLARGIDRGGDRLGPRLRLGRLALDLAGLGAAAPLGRYLGAHLWEHTRQSRACCTVHGVHGELRTVCSRLECRILSTDCTGSGASCVALALGAVHCAWLRHRSPARRACA